jgi:hypothetical protein
VLCLGSMPGRFSFAHRVFWEYLVRMAFGAKMIEGPFEVVEFKDDSITLRRVSTRVEYTIAVAEGTIRKFEDSFPVGTIVAGTMELEDVHHC